MTRDTIVPRAKIDADLFFFVEPRRREEIAAFPEDQCVVRDQALPVSSEVPQFSGNRRADIAEQIFRENTARQKIPSPVPDEIRDGILLPGTTAMAQDFSTWNRHPKMHHPVGVLHGGDSGHGRTRARESASTVAALRSASRCLEIFRCPESCREVEPYESVGRSRCQRSLACEWFGARPVVHRRLQSLLKASPQFCFSEGRLVRR